MVLKSFGIAAALLISGTAHAQDWRKVSEGSTTGSTFFLDADGAGKPQALSRGHVFVRLGANEDGISAIETTLEFECATGRMRVVTMRGYDADHKPMDEHPGADSWDTPGPNTQFGVVGELVCGKEPMPGQSYGSALPFTGG
ncbi:hypothetical protein OF829_17690 [Sphingomonas sp. LB-2]|uniref:hypothetical protein n=1 Tax=Sphingomonas caeni TaxID=2984949 RepID=UPI0022321F0E|nr:hypothetical protein [Sphingomonas caeni]MCW3849075.1 hypothetical protein [Sphingomonas caeni]